MVSRPGKAPTFRALQSRPNRTQSRPDWTHRLPAGFREPPNKPTWPRKTPYATIVVFHADILTVRPGYPARAGIPSWLWGLIPRLRTLAPTVWVLAEQAHKSHHHPCIRPTSRPFRITLHLIWLLLINIYRFPRIRRTIHTTTLYL